MDKKDLKSVHLKMPMGMVYTADQILECINAGVYVTDLNRRIVYWNEGAEKITGWSAAEVVGRCCGDNLLNHVDKEGRDLCGREYCPLHRAIVTGVNSEFPCLVFARGRDGRRIPLEGSVAPIRDELGRVIGGVEIFRDLSLQMRDLERAREIEALSMRLPAGDDPRLRVAAHYAPRDLVGGDFYTVERLDADRYVFLIADLMGHGVAAALYAMHLQGLWEGNRQALARPAAFLDAVNRSLCRLVRDGESFAAGLFGLLDLKNRRAVLCPAGSPSFLHAAASQVQEIKTASLPLGLVPHAEYAETVVDFAPGDGLLFYTDGAIEIFDIAGQLLGGEGLAALVREQGFPATEPELHGLAASLLRSSRDVRFKDDLTMLAFHFAEGP